MSIGPFQRFDLLQVFSDCDCNAGFLTVSPAVSNPGDTQFAAFQFMVLAPLNFKYLSGG